ncbi:hypothetical protein [Pseudomonas qingdaonensis]|uniref:hypothetical protein n=1 Tax=Pseudomonas qingdaonensis TaxID=2056231 RepID=UPI00333E8404
MSRTNYTADQKKAFVRAWLSSRQPKSRWHKEQVAAGNIEGHYNAFDKWVKQYEKGEFGEQPDVAAAPAGGQQIAKPMKHTSPNVLSSVGRNSSLLAEFQQTLLPEDVQAKYVAFLEAKVTNLTSELESLQAENTALQDELASLKMPEPENQ